MELGCVLALAILSLITSVLHTVQERTDVLLLAGLGPVALLRLQLLHLLQYAYPLGTLLLESVLREATLIQRLNRLVLELRTFIDHIVLPANAWKARPHSHALPIFLLRAEGLGRGELPPLGERGIFHLEDLVIDLCDGLPAIVRELA